MMFAPEAVGGLLAVASGACFALIGMAYKLGERRGLLPIQVAFVLATAATIVFGGLALQADAGWPPPRVWVLGALAGSTQYIALRLVQRAMRMGPMSALWCALSLSFVPVVPYAFCVFGQRLTPWQSAGLLAAAGCVLVAARWMGRTRAAPARAPKFSASYLAVLVLIMLFNGGSVIGVTDLSLRQWTDGQTYGARFMMVYLFLFYGWLAALVFTDLAGRRKLLGTKPLLALGALAACGSCGGMLLAFQANQALGSVSWAINGSASIVTMALIDTFGFGERRTPAWYATCALGAAAVVLSSLRSVP